MTKKDGFNSYKLYTPNTLWDVFAYKCMKEGKIMRDEINDMILRNVKPLAKKMGIRLTAAAQQKGTRRRKKANPIPKKSKNQIEAEM